MALPFAGQRAGLLFGEPFGMRELPGDLFVAIQLLMFSGRGDDGHVLLAAFFGRADVDQLHAIGFGGQLLPVGFELGVVGDLIVVAEVEPQRFFGRGYGGGGSRKRQCRQCRNQGNARVPQAGHI